MDVEFTFIRLKRQEALKCSLRFDRNKVGNPLIWKRGRVVECTGLAPRNKATALVQANACSKG